VSQAGPVFSVVVPTKGRPRYLERCLSALAAADYPHDRFEVIVVNDAGGPQVEQVVASAANGLRITMARPERRGPSGARNAGASAARGRFIAFTDDDCEPVPGWLEALERALDANPDAAVGGETRDGVADDSAAVASRLVVDAVHAHFNRDPAAPRFFASSNLAFPAEAFRSVGGFDPDFRYAEDREMCDRWLRAGHPLAHAPDAIVYHMRAFSAREFLRQHYGYGRGAWAFDRVRAGTANLSADHIGVLRALVRTTRREWKNGDRLAVTGYVAVSQAATAAGFIREAIATTVSGQSGRRGAVTG
jgi:GT2 family glycosyltransferase